MLEILEHKLEDDLTTTSISEQFLDVMTAKEHGHKVISPPYRQLRICLAASGGGHVRQLLDLQPAWSAHDHFFVTENTALGASLAQDYRTHFVPHYAIGQARLGAPLRMLGAAFRNFWCSAAIIARERPDFVISTGAGAVFFTVLWARLFGAKTVIIDSFARFDKPSMFARLAAPVAHYVVVQSAPLANYFPRAKVFDPLCLLDAPRPPKKPLLFATVGATLPFDRLVNSVAEVNARGEIPEHVIVQVGIGGHKPAGVETVETLPFDRIQAILKEADIVVCHGGTGSLITALREGCRVVSMPRLLENGEHYDNHQAEITSAFAARGLIAVANSADELAAAIKSMRAATPVSATTNPVQLLRYLDDIFTQYTAARAK